ncbi:hypothetical protein CFC21_091254 [Triticum aestivum]|uniref:Acidic protein n=2 Tax=Triticum aestivum TaxID=4565 RepID=A0A9R1MSW3_WHEAT|nr:uncharacterized protein LOC123142381 [Triticum aestivum]KAF7088108.1 hypothetical protein CFC21_091254 [Triticum aestivum]
MEVKKRAPTIATLCIMSVPSKQQVAAMSFCNCYQQCHDGCRHSVPWWLCNVDCAGNCDSVEKKDALATCIMVCSTDSICDQSVAPTYTQRVADCIAECNKRWGRGAAINAK